MSAAQCQRHSDSGRVLRAAGMRTAAIPLRVKAHVLAGPASFLLSTDLKYVAYLTPFTYASLPAIIPQQ